MKKVGILGGTFDPPHTGHLIVANLIREELNLDEIWFIPTYDSPHKNSVATKSCDRYEMTKLAIADNKYFKVIDWELKESNKSYTINTMSHFKKENPEIDFYFIIGADMVEYLPKWDSIDSLLKLVTFVGVSRVGYSLESEYPIIKKTIPNVYISSSYLRKRVKNNESIKYLVPDNVEAYIKEFNLYESKRDTSESKSKLI